MRFGSASKFLTAGALLLGAGIAVAYAATADEAIKGRQGCMKGHAATMKVMVPMFKGEAAFDAAAIQTVFAQEAAACADWGKWWGPETAKGETLETWAKAEIWSDPKGFEEAGGKWYQAHEAVKASADEAAFKASFPALGEACKGCHDKFRRPKE